MRWQPQGLWKNPDFMKIWLSKTISNIGDGITNIALPLIAIQMLAATPAQISIISALGGAAVVLFGLLAGVWVDRLRRRPIVIATDLGRALLLCSIPIAAFAGILHMEQVYIVAACTGVLAVFFNAADVALLPDLVQAQELVEGNSKLGISDALAEMVGPALAGVLVQVLSAPLALLLDVCSFLCSAWCIARIGKPEPELHPADQQRSMWHESIEGIVFVFKHPLLRTLAGGAGIFNCFGMFIGTLYTFYIVRTLGLAPIVLGFSIAAGGLSSLAGAWFAERVVRTVGLGWAIGGGLLAYGLLGLPLPFLYGPAPLMVALLLGMQLIGDVAVAIHLISELSLRQMLIPPRLMGRANMGVQLLTQGVMPLGALLAGVLAEQLGVRATLLIGVLGVTAAGLWLLLSPVRKIRSTDVFPL